MKPLGILPLLLLTVLLANCLPLPPGPTPVPPTIQGPTVTAREVAGLMRFDPGTITLTVGQRVRLTFVNAGSVAHEIKFEGLAAEDIQTDWFGAGRITDEKMQEIQDLAAKGIVAGYALPGHSMAVEFTPTSVGTFEYSCHLPGHSEHGMGELFVR